ncbi:bacterial transferase hexapeptide family protein [Paraburkholderia xenovorans LB400]|uniref:Transferase, hexapeptide repeat protein n=1 Tax=Paraburkholderia xenovorans (strain LB400) TaxID=266265 RepID=Q13GJ7_PARXL|nr:transferase hexapeptide repeat family protein [Paraburkholderia xenovorans]ABE36792.1 transferase, hexapeptide repeat protein [Paraburkholderia xenovorans LB400]AIP34931.1 bacterial transferase hexapeptide family protein [Paraburkholderia xenovorans LB400]
MAGKYYSFDGVSPEVSGSAFVHPTAVLIGRVTISDHCYIGPHATLRGDGGVILLREGAIVQDSCTIHGRNAVLEVGSCLGHNAVVHGARIGEGALVGISSVVLDEAVVGSQAILGALSLLTARTLLPDRHLATGIPAKVLRALSGNEVSRMVEGGKHYEALTMLSIRTMNEERNA